MNDFPHTVAGIGVGPANLSLAALMAPLDDAQTVFFEQKPAFSWHPGLLFETAALQTSFLKDLVTAADPTSPYSFVSFLVAKKRFYRFLSANFGSVLRSEFAEYMGWVAERIDALRFGASVRDVTYGDGMFLLRHDKGAVRARHLAVGSGSRPRMPEWVRADEKAACIHSSRFLLSDTDLAGKRVAVVGGGQSGAEIFEHLIAKGDGMPSHIAWISRRPNFLPLDESAFTNEWFTPGYVAAFQEVSEQRKQRLLAHQKLASDGISDSTLTGIYRRLYDLHYLQGRPDVAALMPGREVVDMRHEAGGARLTLRNDFSGAVESVPADVVILATGYEWYLPDCLDPLTDRIDVDGDGRLRLDARYRVSWSGPGENRIYAQNAARHSHGVADAQLSLLAWRSAVIVNDIMGRAVYDVGGEIDPIQWTPGLSETAVPAAV